MRDAGIYRSCPWELWRCRHELLVREDAPERPVGWLWRAFGEAHRFSGLAHIIQRYK